MPRRKPIVESSALQVRVNWTWLILALLVIWTLAIGYFPAYDMRETTTTYWIMAIAALGGLLVSVLLHELCHLLMARAFGLGGNGITLFVFGGISNLEREPNRPVVEFWVSVVGPVFSAVLGFAFAILNNYGNLKGWSLPVVDVLYYLSTFNFVIALFNLIPAFPLDGGRIFRSILWAWKKDIIWSTKIASSIGVGFGFLLIIFGILQFLTINFLNGVWMFFLGMFLIALAQSSYNQLLMATLLAHEPVENVMKQETLSVTPETSIRDFVKSAYRYHKKLFPVMDGARLLGCVGLKNLKGIPEQEWEAHKVREVTEGCTPETVIDPKEDVIQALKILNKSKTDELIVADHGRLVGKLTQKDILDFFSLKLELEEGHA